MAERNTYFADVILPLALPNLYTYRIPHAWNGKVSRGMRVVVQFGRSKLCTAIVYRVHENAPGYTTKYIESLLDPGPVVNETQLRLWDWLSSYYMCARGEVMLAALPSGLRLSSETRIIRNSTYTGDGSEFDDQAFLIFEALELREVLSLEDIEQILDKKTVYPVIRKLLDSGAVIVQEEIKDKFKPKFDTYIKLSAGADNEDQLKIIFDELEKRAYKQLELLMAFIQLSGRYSKGPQEVKKSELMKAVNASQSALQALVEKNIFVAEEREVSRFDYIESTGEVKELNGQQQRALSEIQIHFSEKDVVLLHGVTSSGKTEVYVKLISEQIEKQKQVLYLLPEIALTAQIIVRLQKKFGDNVQVYHSKFNENERIEIWKRVQEGKPMVVLGARSSLFLPYENLGLVIIDEEHDSSFKQFDPAPRYNARESAIYLAHLHKTKTLLGSATPSVESYFNAKNDKYGLVEMQERFGGILLPEIVVVDVREETRKKKMKSYFSPLLVEEMEKALENKEQVILFQNRRGFALSIVCQDCEVTPHCIRCDVSLTYHKHADQLRCHYCGYTTKPPVKCEACGSTNMRMRGFGTERIEEELALIFPKIKIMRMDLDTTRAKHAHRQIINDFEERNIDVLVGTQMVTKGLDFDHVALVGILNADSMLNFPDFRAWERSYQLMAQVAGRSGRKKKQGKVIIQTHNPQHVVVQYVVNNDFTGMYNFEIAERRKHHYPPFHRLIEITLKSKDLELLNYAAKEFGDALRTHFGEERILGPEAPSVGRVRDEFLKNILLKFEREASIVKVKQIIESELTAFRARNEFRKIRVVIDVDPL
ncbi:MAG: primosomal protein N'' [Bacteroidetes bacterium]|nr:MAG: primosomal protein N'' [Bacteroidota bacterium]